MKLPEARPENAEYSYVRQHDLDEIWEPARVPEVASSHAARHALLMQLVETSVVPPARILDVGCAQGTLGLRLAERGYHVTLLDIREGNIDYARQRHEQGEVKFMIGLFSPDCPPDADYDMVACTEVIEHVPTPARLLVDIASKVRPGGFVLLTTPNAEYALSHLPSYGVAPQRVLDVVEANSCDGDAHRYLFNRDELHTLIRGVGLTVVESGFFLPFWLEGHLKTRFLHRILFRITRKPVSLRATLPVYALGIGRYLCASQFVVARRD